MGRTLYGVDLDESPFGGLIKRLLTDEELQALTDGGRPGDGSSDSAEDAASSSDSADDFSDESDWGRGSDSDAAIGVGHGGDVRPSSLGSETDDCEGSADDAGGGRVRGFVSSHKGLLLKGGVVLAVLATIGVVVWRYKDKIRGLVPDRLGGGSDDDSVDSSDTPGAGESDVSPARRRAKRPRPEDDAEAERETDSRVGTETDTATHREGKSGPERPGRESSSADVSTSEADVDLGALVGLGTLALIAAIVRKFGEDRPHDPLVDGPEDES